jgi:hypothetical protein
MTAASGDAPQAPKSRYDALLAQSNSAIDQVRTVAKWMIAAVGAVASLLVAGIQLTSIGKVSTERAWIAGIMVCIVICAAATAIAKLATVLLPEITTRDDVIARAQGNDFARFLDKHSYLLGGAANAAELASEQKAAVQRAREPDASEPEKATARRLTEALNMLVPFGSYFVVRTNFSRAKVWTLSAAVIGGLAIVGYARAVGTVTSEPPSAAANPEPVAVTVRLNAAGAKALKSSLGSACARQLSQPSTERNAIAVHASGGDVELIIIPSGECQTATRFTLRTPNLGQATAPTVVLPKATETP